MMEIQIIQIWVFSPLSQFKLASQLTRDLILPVCIISYFYDLIINPAYFGHYDPSGGKPPGPFVFLCIQEMHIMILGTKIDIDMADPRKISLARWQQIIISFCYPITRHSKAQNMELFTWTVSDISIALAD